MAKKEASPQPKLPFSVGDRAAFIRKACVAVELVQVPTVRMVSYNLAYDRVEVIDLPVSRIAGEDAAREQYYVDGGHVQGGPSTMAKTHLSWLRSRALESGATSDAIRLLSKATSTFTKKEEAQMAEKLKSKKTAAPKSANTDELKTAAKTTPVAKNGKTSDTPRRGNPEALAKARAARSAGPDTRKIRALKKVKDLTARPGTFRHTMLSDAIASKTVQEFRGKNPKYDAGCLKFAIDSGTISVS